MRYIRITPRKFRQIIPLVKGKNPEKAVAILTAVNKKAAGYAVDLLNSAIANAKRKQGVEVSNLYISKFVADGGPMLKRFRAASMGRAAPILKRTSHITVELDEIAKPKEAKEKGHIAKEKKAQGPAVKKAKAKESHKKGKE